MTGQTGYTLPWRALASRISSFQSSFIVSTRPVCAFVCVFVCVCVGVCVGARAHARARAACTQLSETQVRKRVCARTRTQKHVQMRDATYEV